MIALLALLACQTAGGDAAATEEPAPPPVKARLVADRSAPAPGAPLVIGVLYEIPPEWHIYWANPGDSGLATTASLTAPAGFDAPPEPAYPGPERFVSPGDITSYGYEGTAMLLWRLQVPPEAAGPATFTARTDWLACKQICVKGGADLSLTLDGSTPAVDVKPFVEGLPRPLSSLAGLEARWSEDRTRLEVDIPAAGAVALYPDSDTELALAEHTVTPVGRSARLAMTFKSPARATPGGVVSLRTPAGATLFYDLSTLEL
ncbi:MAG: hypothetical protein H6739_34030 [Alphaproteobacteria bacterium]|nr:hypothetical protein [Alphaproteobacteria bacterium]